ncbi:MAG TPA: glycosyltransferase family 39 protein [Gemmatimonadota bacterium]|jgi:4-amino-4-deoxy-L-arabinose transferase
MRGWLPDPLARRPLVPLLALAATVLLWHLGACGLWESTEARYAEIAARMVRSGDWLTPRLNGIAHFDKPPLAYWASAASMALLGIDELGARLPLVVASLVTMAVVYGAATATMCPRAAGFAFLVLLSSPIWFALSRSVTTDLYLTLWVVIAVEAARRGTHPGGSRAWRVLAWGALGLGFLTKGPVVLLWTALPLLAWAAWTRAWRRTARLADPLGLAAFALLALPWYLVEAARHPGLMDSWLKGQIAGRVAAPYRGENDPWWLYGLTLSWAAWVWIVPAIVMLGRLARERDRPGGRFLVAWVTVPLVAFSLFPTKRANYLLPAVPAIALAAGAWWDLAMESRAPLGRAIPRALGLGVAAFGVGFTIAAFVVEDLPGPVTALGWLFGPTFVLGGIAAWRAATRARLDLAFTALLLPILGLFVGLVAALGHPRVEAWSKISRPLIREIAAHRLSDEPIVNYHVWLRAIPFYLDERVITVTDEGRVTTFEEDDAWRDYVFTADSSFFRMMAEPGRLLAVARRSEVDDIEARLGRPVTVLARDSRYALVTNSYP